VEEVSIHILGVDPGFAKIGWTIARLSATGVEPVAMGLITTKKSDKKLKVLASDDNVRRAREIVVALDSVLVEYNVYAICAESKSFPRNASAAAKVAICWGILVKTAVSLDVPLIQARPQEIKQKLCGKANASKKEIQAACDQLYGIDTLQPLVEGVTRSNLEHPYDALATVIACSDSEVLRLARKMSAG
jgi:crossover junction endodeoxyribonuclease RuvC